MNLPANAVGPTDIQQYRDCPRRFAFGIRRHTEAGEHPEAQGPATAYGAAIHKAIEVAEAAEATDAQAVQVAFDSFAKWLEPEDLERLHTDLDTYRGRDYLGVRTVAVEQELRIPLFEHKGETIYLRTRIDRLYQRIDNPAVFVHVDYKSSAWPMSQKQLDEDTQFWITNLIVHEHWPECETLVQVCDQLNFGQLPTRKSDAQRATIRAWAIHQITTILADEQLAPTKNRWCPWCPVLESCPIVREFSDFALAEIAALAPAVKQGRTTTLTLDPAIFDVYVEQLGDVELALKVLKRYDDTLRERLRQLPATQRRSYGFDLGRRSKTSWPPEALRAAHEVLGDDFYELVGLTKTAVERLGDDRAELVMDMAVTNDGPPVLRRRESARTP